MSLVASMMSANGRMAPADFQKAGFVLVAISFFLALTPLFLPLMLAGLISLLGLVLIYPWVCIWSKRLHDAGKSGWLFLVVMVVWIILGLIVSQVVTLVFGGEAARMVANAMETGNMDAMLQANEAVTKTTALPTAIINALVGVGVVLAGNAILKQEPQENRYGPVPGADTAPAVAPAAAPAAAPSEAPADAPATDEDAKP